MTLDDTLWPGIAADDGFGWVGADRTSSWIHAGLHQALLIAKHRGVLLASVSKGDERATLDRWAELRYRGLLTPDDFVLHRINWAPKSDNIQHLCDALGLAPDDIVFLDDNPVERAEVRRHLSAVRVPELAVHEMREWILTHPGMEATHQSQESRHRTESTRASLRALEMSRGRDLGDFIAELAVTMRVREARPQDLGRAAELLNRTNQFTTTTLRTTEAQLRGDLGAGRLFLMNVSDRHADYGCVGVLLLQESEVTAMAISCRVIALDVGPAFLLACLAALPEETEVTGRFVKTDRNTPASEVFARSGFQPVQSGTWRRTAGGAARALDSWPHAVVLEWNPEGKAS